MHALDVARRKPVQQRREVRHPALAPTLHDSSSFRRRLETVHTTVVRVAGAADEARRLEPLHDARHRRRPDLLRRCELPERARTAEYQHRESGELSRRDSGFRIFPAHVAQSVDGRRVEAVRGID